MKTLSNKKFPYAVKSVDGSEYISDHKTEKAAQKRADRQTKMWKGKRFYKVFKR